MGVPAYLQIMNLIKKEIYMGNLKDGDQLPPVRKLAETIGVNTNTVIRSLEKLQYEGIVEAQHGVGYFIKITREINRELLDAIENLVEDLKTNDINLEMATLLIEEVWKK